MTRLKRSETILAQLIAGDKLSCLFKIGKKKDRNRVHVLQ